MPNILETSLSLSLNLHGRPPRSALLISSVTNQHLNGHPLDLPLYPTISLSQSSQQLMGTIVFQAEPAGVNFFVIHPQKLQCTTQDYLSVQYHSSISILGVLNFVLLSMLINDVSISQLLLVQTRLTIIVSLCSRESSPTLIEGIHWVQRLSSI